jgi:transcriptional regulator with XRE-family HTH domain
MTRTGTLAQTVPASTTDPTIARRRLGIKLRELREAQSLRLEDVATSLGVAPSTLSRIETGKAPAKRAYLSGMLNLYRINDPKMQRLLERLAREGQGRPWWYAGHDLLPDGAGRYLSLESTASLVHSYSTQTVPALLQTADYAAAVCQAARPSLSRDQVHKLVSITMRRQQMLHDSGASLHAVIDESGLLRSIASADVMAAQIDHLLALAARSSVTVQVTTLAMRVPVLSPAFTVLSFSDPTDDDVAVSYDPGDQVVNSTRRRDADVMLATFATLAQAALSPTDSVSMISDLASKLR